MTITILKLSPGQTIPRPLARASDWQEGRELIGRHVAYDTEFRASGRHSWAGKAADERWSHYADQCMFSNLDSETPVLETDRFSFFAFIEL